MGGGGDQGDSFLVTPLIEWWEGRRDRGDAKRAARNGLRERRGARRTWHPRNPMSPATEPFGHHPDSGSPMLLKRPVARRFSAGPVRRNTVHSSMPIAPIDL